MIDVTIALCTLAALVGLPLGYFFGFVLEEADRIMDAYLEGSTAYYLELEVWR